MLTWTHAGAVASPTVLQIRVTRHFPGRVAAGAPEPGRSLTSDEVRDNIRHFTVQRRGPRTQPCTALVLSGVQLDLPGLESVLDEARAWGIERVTVHLGREGAWQAPMLPGIDAVAVTVSSEHDAQQLGRLAGVFVTAVVVLDQPTLPRLPALTAALAQARPDRVVFTWPFPPAAPPPPAADAASAVERVLPLLDAAGVQAGLKGLPACRLTDPDRLWRSGNRWYVDAAHQQEAALLFFPEVARFAKGDVCRFCALTARCEGAPAQWLETGLAGTLVPRI